ncbi:MAG: hypothetical protein BWX72_00527 [Firmicutes bacterium ADurb.Bin080]|nr:hypothetical protein [Clostridiales bacterium]OQC16684.1 MAG: hypothetical protein BWX72_00527 [Firmicutes bacterium ADurb.Bin080]
MEKISSFLIAKVMALGVFGLAGCENVSLADYKEEVTVDGISNQFDLTELKEYWTGSIDDDFEDDRVVVIMKKTTTYPELDVETFGLDNAESLHYSFLAPKNENPNFHQILVIFLKTKGKDQVILAINELNKLDFIKTASPEYIYGTQDD